MRHGLVATLLFACAAAPLAVMAQTTAGFPSQPIRLVVPYPPGGSADVLARTLGKQIAEDLGQNVIVENKPGRARPSAANTWPARQRMAIRC